MVRAYLAFGVLIIVFATELVLWQRMKHRRAWQGSASLVASPPIGTLSEDEGTDFQLEYGLLTDSGWISATQTALGRVDCAHPLGDSFYFPKRVFFRKTRSGWDADRSDRRDFSRVLHSMREPSLSCGSRPSRDYRFLWIRSFHQPVVIRITVPADRDQASSVLIDGGSDAAQRTERRRFPLTDRDQRRLMAALAISDFWSMPSTSGGPGADGANWVIEARSGAAYHVVSRWSPRPRPLRDLGLLFMQLAKLPTTGRFVY